MDFSSFGPCDWDFLRAAATAGLDSPLLDEGHAEIIEVYLRAQVAGEDWSEPLAGALREAFGIGWNVATENGTNDLAARRRHVAAAVGLDLAGTPAP